MTSSGTVTNGSEENSSGGGSGTGEGGSRGSHNGDNDESAIVAEYTLDEVVMTNAVGGGGDEGAELGTTESVSIQRDLDGGEQGGHNGVKGGGSNSGPNSVVGGSSGSSFGVQATSDDASGMLMSRFTLRTTNAIAKGACSELNVSGMLRAKFSAVNKLREVEMTYDVMSTIRQVMYVRVRAQQNASHASAKRTRAAQRPMQTADGRAGCQHSPSLALACASCARSKTCARSRQLRSLENEIGAPTTTFSYASLAPP